MKGDNGNVSSNFDITNKYLEAMQTEGYLSPSYETSTRIVLNSFSRFHNGKPFAKMDRNDVISYLNSFRKSDKIDPLHQWIGTYNTYLIALTRFFKWLYKPKLEPKRRPKPEIVQNIQQLRRREQSIYKPTDLWTKEDDLLFLKYCPSNRDRCYHTISRDTSARPSEILNLKIKDIVFKTAGAKQYAEVLVNGKTGTRQLPLIDSLPYVKDWLDHHPQRNNRNAFLICSLDRKNFGGQLTRFGIREVYVNYKEKYFPKLLESSDTLAEDKDKIRELLRKPWNLYIRRHSALTEKSKFLKESTLRQHAGWSPRSHMNEKYVHYYGNESNNSILQEFGILPKDNVEVDVLRPKQCPHCNEPNRPDQKFCVKCRLALTFDAYVERQDETALLRAEIEDMRLAQRELRILLKDPVKLKKVLEAD